MSINITSHSNIPSHLPHDQRHDKPPQSDFDSVEGNSGSVSSMISNMVTKFVATTNKLAMDLALSSRTENMQWGDLRINGVKDAATTAYHLRQQRNADHLQRQPSDGAPSPTAKR